MRRPARNELRLAVTCLPSHTRVAMLEGLDRYEIIVGSYTDRRGGACPMLAAHRCGGRTDFLAFAYAWDRFTRAKRPRRATEREVGVLRAYLTETFADEAPPLADAIAEHQASARARRAREARQTGWDWLADAEAEAVTPDERQPERVA